jgi:hypothetical protein
VFVGVYEEGECGEWERKTLGELVVRTACRVDGVGDCCGAADIIEANWKRGI